MIACTMMSAGISYLVFSRSASAQITHAAAMSEAYSTDEAQTNDDPKGHGVIATSVGGINMLYAGPVPSNANKVRLGTDPALLSEGYPDGDQEPLIEDVPEPEYVPDMTGHLTARKGVFNGPSGRETWYDLDMGYVVKIMRSKGFSEEEYPYWITDDGLKMLGDYIMVAANLETRPKGTILETSLGMAIVCDTGEFVEDHPDGIDIAVDWKNWNNQ